MVAMAVGGSAIAGLASAEEQTSEFRIVGLFSTDREQDLRDLAAKLPGLNIAGVDFENAKVTLRYDLHQLFPDEDPRKKWSAEEIQNRLNDLLTNASMGTFGLKPLPTTPANKLTKLELHIGILDCKGCRYGAYLMVIHVSGVEEAIVGLNRMLTVWIDPSKTDRAAVEEALKKGNVEVVGKT